MSHHQIKEGDIVNVFWEHIEPLFNMRVIYAPCATGDSWHLVSEDNEKLVYVNSFAKMEKQS